MGSRTGQEAKSSDARNTNVLSKSWPSRLSTKQRDLTAFRFRPWIRYHPVSLSSIPFARIRGKWKEALDWRQWMAKYSGSWRTSPPPLICTSNTNPITGTPLPPFVPLSVYVDNSTSQHLHHISTLPSEVGHGSPAPSSFRNLLYRSHRNVPIPRSHVCPMKCILSSFRPWWSFLLYPYKVRLFVL